MNKPHSCLSRIMRLSIVGTALILASAVWAQAPQRHYMKIEAQPLAQALQSFAEQSNLQVLFFSEISSGLKSKPLAGNVTHEQALRELLDGTGLSFKFINDRTVTISSSMSSGAEDQKLSAVSAMELPLRLAQVDTTEPDKSSNTGENTSENTPPSSAESKTAPVLVEILVTAEKRTESIHDLPIAISAFSAETLEKRGIVGIESLQQIVPSLQYSRGNDLDERFSIRGIGTEVPNISGAPSVAVSQNGVTYSSLELARVDFMDVERVEVLRGPQGTISGRNATAGAIHIHSKRPTEEFEGGFKATLGNFSRLATEGYLSGPLVGDRLLGRLAVRTDRADGWVNNTFLGEEVGSTDKLQARATFLARVSDQFEASLILDGTHDRSNTVIVDDGRLRPDVPSLPEFFGAPGYDRDRRTVQHDLAPNVDTERYQVTLRLAWDLGPSASLTAISGYVDLYSSNIQEINDGTLAPALVWDPNDPLIYDISQLSQEVTLTADLTEQLDVIAGAIYSRSDAKQTATIGLPLLGLPLGSISVAGGPQLVSWAGYTQLRYRVTDDVRLSAGVRYTHDSSEYDFLTVVFGDAVIDDAEASWSAWTPRFAVDYAPNEDLTLYASVSRGFKSGGFVLASAPLNQFDPEFVWNYEAGLKANWRENRLKTALTAFYMDYTDLQTSIYGLDPGSVFSQVVNAESATNKGVELELEALLTDRFRITAAGTWLDATYDELRTHDPLFPELGVLGPAGLNVRDLSGNRLIRAPKLQFNVSGEFRTPLGENLEGVLGAAYAWQDDMFFDFYNHEGLTQDAYGLINLSAAVETRDGAWQFSAFVHNLTDKFYKSHMDDNDIAPVRYSSAIIGLPRMYGVSLAHRF